MRLAAGQASHIRPIQQLGEHPDSEQLRPLSMVVQL